MLGKKGSVAALIVGELKKKRPEGKPSMGFGMSSPGAEEADGEEEGGGEDEATMGEFMDALKAGDKTGALEAFKALVEAC
jgi:hypothetical protein